MEGSNGHSALRQKILQYAAIKGINKIYNIKIFSIAILFYMQNIYKPQTLDVFRMDRSR